MISKKITHSTNLYSRKIKPVVQYLLHPKGYKSCLMIMGCQRSGTTMLTRIFDILHFSKVFSEFNDEINRSSDYFRLLKGDKLNTALKNNYAPLIVLKPLVESQNANLLLKQIKNSKILWLYRNYLDVGLSDIKKFNKNPGHGNLLPIIKKETDNWRYESMSSETEYLVNSIYSPKLSPLDCACLFWYIRNVIFFEQKLQHNKNVFLWSYENFLQAPLEHINNLLTHLNLPKQNTKIVKNIYQNPNDVKLPINKDIIHLCEPLLKKFVKINSQV